MTEQIHHTPRQPEEYPRRILLAVTGLTPQVVTETLFALSQTHQPSFIPTEIHLITTREGADRARLMLLDPDEGRYFQLLSDFGIAATEIQFEASQIHLITGPDGEPLDDICSEEDNTAVADAITQRVRDFTADPACAIHASIAGGRKTMGFYLGYAMSLYGRPQDRLSHVLVNAPFESDHQFYYPPARPHRMIIKDQPVHTSDARVMLADIPFVRMREGLPEQLQIGASTFSKAVSVAQKALLPAELCIDTKRGSIRAAGEQITLPDAQFAFYAWLAHRRLNGDAAIRWTDSELTNEYLAFYRSRCGPMSARVERLEEVLASGFTKEWFEQTRSKTNTAIRKVLGDPLSRSYLIQAIGTRPKTRYGLTLPEQTIKFCNTPKENGDHPGDSTSSTYGASLTDRNDKQTHVLISRKGSS